MSSSKKASSNQDKVSSEMSELEDIRIEFRDRLYHSESRSDLRMTRIEGTLEEIKNSNNDLKMMFMAFMASRETDSVAVKASPVDEVKEKDGVRLSDLFDEDHPQTMETIHVKDQRRLSQSFANAVEMQKAIEANQGNIQYAKKTPDTSRIYLGSFNEREIVEWESRWDELQAAHPTYPFNIPETISNYVRDKCISNNEIEGGIHQFNRAGLPQLLRWICKCIRPVSNLMFLEKLENNVYFRSKKDFVLTEKNLRDFFQNLKVFAREFTFLLDLLTDSLNDGQDIPPLCAKENSIWSVFLRKIPCDYGYATALEMENVKHKLKTFQELRDKFLEISKLHCGLSEGTTKLSYVVNYRRNKNNERPKNSDNFHQKSEGDFRKRFTEFNRKKHEDRGPNRLSMIHYAAADYEYGEEERYSKFRDTEDAEEAAFQTRFVEEPDDLYEYHGGDTDGAVYSRSTMDPRTDVSNPERNDEDEYVHKLQAFAQDQNRFGPSPSFPSNRFPPKTGGAMPLRKPPPVPGPCFKILQSGTCEAFKMGRCTYDHSEAAITANIKKQQDNANAFFNSASKSNELKPRA